MKKFLISLVLLVILIGCSGGDGTSSKKTLRIFNVGAYIDTELLKKFEQQENVQIVYETFDSNESMIVKVETGGSQYDLVVPSDYMIEKMIKDDMLLKIDHNQIPNLKYLLASTKNKHYDPNMEYSVPYFWGNVGIVYDKTKIDASDVESQGWEVLRNPKYKGMLYFYDSERDAFMVALKALGYSMNSENPQELEKAYQWLLEMNQTMSPVFVDDQSIDGMISGNKYLANMYSGDAAHVLSENKNLAYYVPHQGTNIWQDAMVILKDAKEPELAMKFMNFMLDPENNKQNSLEVGYQSVLESVFNELVSEGGNFYENEAYMIHNNDKNEEFVYHPKTRQIISDYWTKVKGN